ncbi:hypothetical protein TWF281_006583 [Arthrobotrys megalospora]
MLFGEQYKGLWNELEAEREYTKVLQTDIQRLKQSNEQLSWKLQALTEQRPTREELYRMIAELEIQVRVLENENATLEVKLAQKEGYISFPRPNLPDIDEE